jgi:hypothetical protein
MFRNRWLILVAVIVVVGLLVWGWQRSGGRSTSIDLISLLPSAEKRTGQIPKDEAITVATFAINGDSKPCILQPSTSRIIFKLTPPADAWFSASIAVDPAVWDKEGDGVLFRMGVSDGKNTYEELLNQAVNPVANPNDRRWIPVALDLSEYAGRNVEIILNINASVSGSGRNDSRNDRALWGAPSLVVGR